MVCPSAKGQTNEWVWMNGPKTPQAAVYGTLGTPTAQNMPGNRTSPINWTDNQGNLWFFSGEGWTSTTYGYPNDLWRYSPTTKQWAWMGGSSILDRNFAVAPAVPGTMGTPNTGNIPQGRTGSATWKDAQGNLWLFGGYNYNNGDYYLNDLWKFNPATNEWTWMGGDTKTPCTGCHLGGVYGTINTASAGNIPGGRTNAVSWTDSQGNFWLFGGNGLDSTGRVGRLNDLWEFSPSINQWTWRGGSTTVPSSCNSGRCSSLGMYGAQGTASSTSLPGGRESASGWTDSDGNFWLFGGLGVDSTGTLAILNDLWKFSPSTNQWTWVAGSSTIPVECNTALASQCGARGIYGTQNVSDATNVPGARQGAAVWTDHQGNFWLFGGDGVDSVGKWGYLNDLWEYSPSTNQWTWMRGNTTVICATTYCGQPGVYGTLQTPAMGNTPGGRAFAAAWTDSDGSLWLFGGTGVNVVNTWGDFQDLWQFQSGTGGLPVAATPTFSPASGTYTTVQTVTINDATPGATIYYLINGNTPAIPYTGPITVSSSTMIQAVAQAGGYANSAIATARYTLNVAPVATPTFSPVPGTYTTPQTVTISESTAGATVYYTTDGTLPTTSSAVYSGPLTVTSPQTILAIAVANGLPNSAVGSAVYTIGPDSNLGKWAWMGGGRQQNLAGTYGALKTPSAGNIPGARTQSTSWTDSSGNLWLFGGQGYDASGGNRTLLNDLWQYNPSAHVWTWMGGSNLAPCTTLLNVTTCTGQPGVYGTLGTPATGNIPGGRYGATGWTDAAGRRWLFGGNGIASNGQAGLLNDLWLFDPSTMNWTWMGGSNTSLQKGVYGTLGVPDAANIPGGRTGAVSWVDGKGKFWLYGGTGLDAGGQNVTLNDLWEFDPATMKWAWMSGSNILNILVPTQPPVFGTQGVAAAENTPGSLTGAEGWTDANGDLWLFGNGNLWKYGISTNQWAWISGIGARPCPFSPIIGYNVCTSTPGIYGTLGLPDAANVPAGDNPTATWTDLKGNFWLFGGYPSDVTRENAGFYKGYVNALWNFNPSTKGWAWMGGDYAASNCSVVIFIPIPFIVCDGSQGVFGTQFLPDAANIPAARTGAVSWTDKNGNFWLFSGATTTLADNPGYVNDLWEYQPSTTTFPPATAPIFSLKSGTYATGGPLILSNGMTNASIYYTTDGTTPTTASNLYSGPIPVSSTETVKAIAVAPGYRNSSVAVANYTVPSVPAPAAPTFSVLPGTYTTVQKVTISDATPGATIYYTTDGTTPVATSSVYSGPITLTSSQTITALAVVGISGSSVWYGIDLPGGGGAAISSVAKAAYVINLPQAVTPTFSVAGGTYSSTQTVSISDATPGATIHYTIDGTTPTATSYRYSGGISVYSSLTIQAIAVADGYANSAVATAVYTISPAPNFMVTTSSSAVFIKSGGQGTLTLTVTPQNGFNSPVTFACSSGLPAGVTCSFSPSTVIPTGSAMTNQVTFVGASQSAGMQGANSRQFLPVATTFTTLCFFGLRRRRLQPVLLLILTVTGSAFLSGCGSSSGSGSSPRTTNSTVTITATSGTLQQKTSISLTLN